MRSFGPNLLESLLIARAEIVRALPGGALLCAIRPLLWGLHDIHLLWVGLLFAYRGPADAGERPP